MTAQGIPLALELAAAWVRVLTCDEIADEIQRNINFLALADRDTVPRHRSMRAVFEHSWALLTTEERAGLIRSLEVDISDRFFCDDGKTARTASKLTFVSLLAVLAVIIFL